MSLMVARGRMASMAARAVRNDFPEVEVVLDDPRSPALRAIAEADILVGDFTIEELTSARKLRWLNLWSAGVDQHELPLECAGRVRVTACKGNGAIPLAEHALMLLLMLSRSMGELLEAQKGRRWKRAPHPELAGSTIGVVGLGHVGRELARRCDAFGMRVIGTKRHPEPVPHVSDVLEAEAITELCRRADHVVVTAPLTRETRGSIGWREFDVMGSSAFYVCVSRGGIADDTALIDALVNGRIAGAGLDAHSVEPLPPDSPFWSLPNTIITPHIGALTPQSEDRRVTHFLTNLRRYLAGRSLHDVIDWSSGY